MVARGTQVEVDRQERDIREGRQGVLTLCTQLTLPAYVPAQPMDAGPLPELPREIVDLRRRPRYVPNPRPETYQSNVELDLSLARQEIGYEPTVQLAEGIRRMVQAGA